MRALVKLGVLGLVVGAFLPSAAQARTSQRGYVVARPVFALAAPGGRGVRRAAASSSATRHASNTVFAGYSAVSSGAADVVARFTVPGVVCSKREAAIGPGAFLIGGPHDRVSFNSANVIVGCYRHVATAQEAMEVNGVEFDYVRPVQPGDVLVAHLTDAPNGKVTVQLRNLNPRRRFVLTRSGRGFSTDAALVGDWASADAQSGAPVPPPQFDLTAFRSISVDGRPFGAASPAGYDMASSRNVLQVVTSPLRGAAGDGFTCKRLGA